MGKTVLQNRILRLLEEAYGHQQLHSSITYEMLPKLAEAIEPVIKQYVAKYGSHPNIKIFRKIVNNFAQDGPRVQALLKTGELDEQKHWLALQSYFVRYAQQKWPMLTLHHQKEIAKRACLRMRQTLFDFLFLASFVTWGSTILLVEYWRLKKEIGEIEIKTT